MKTSTQFFIVWSFLIDVFRSNAQELVPSFTVELAIVCDMDFSKSFDYNEESITEYWINEVQDLKLKFGTLRKTNIKFTLTTVMVIKNAADQPFIEDNRNDNGTIFFGVKIRSDFSEWVFKKANELQSDMVILATGRPTEFGISLSSETVCKKRLLKDLSVIVLRSGPGKWHYPHTLAESVANLLGGEDNVDNDCKGSGLISDKPINTHRRWYFSNCSDFSIHRFIMDEKPGCLNYIKNSRDLTKVTTRPRRVLNFLEQCKLFFNDSTIQATGLNDESDMCVYTLCVRRISQSSQVGSIIFPIYNTPCREDNWFCFRGRCLQRGVLIRHVKAEMCILSTITFGENDYAQLTDCPEIPEKYHEFMIDDKQKHGLVLSMVYTNMQFKDKCLTVDQNESKLKFGECPEMDISNFAWDFVDAGNGEFYFCHRYSKTCAVVDDSEDYKIIFVNATLVLDNPLSLWKFHSYDEGISDSSKYIRTGWRRFSYCQHYYNEPGKLKCCNRTSSFQKCKPQEVTTTTTEPPKTTTTTEAPKTTTTTEAPTTTTELTTTTTSTTTEPTTLMQTTSEHTTTEPSTSEPTSSELTTLHTTITTATTEFTTVALPTLQTSNPITSTLKPIVGIEPQNIVSNEGKNDYLWLIYLTLSLVVLLIIVIGAVFLFKFLRKSKRDAYKSDVISLDKFYKGDKSKINANEGVASQADLLPFDKHWEFPMSRLKLGQKLGSGAFGLVVEAKAIGILENEAETTVAVKMVNTSADVTHLKALMTELKIMSHLGGHLNIVNLLGACTKSIAKTRQLYVIIEFCKYGCLRSYLHKHKSHFVDDTNTSFYSNNPKPEKKNLKAVRNVVEISRAETETLRRSNNNGSSSQSRMRPQIIPGNEYTQSPVEARAEAPRDDNNFKTITEMDLMCWSFQIARGMEYLASKRVLHGDLAARNCLLAENNVVKICDFGFAKTLNKDYDYNYKKNCEGVLLPFKWMAIESMKCGIFSSESDCWSYGVVLWEIFTLGESPYPGFNVDHNFIEYVSNGNRMSKPQNAPQRMYDLMLQCWSHDPEERPKFSTIVDTIGEMLEKDICEHYVKMNSDYQNISKFATKSDLLLKMGESERHKGCATEPQNIASSSNDTSQRYQVGKKFASIKPARLSSKVNDVASGSESLRKAEGCVRFSKHEVELHV